MTIHECPRCGYETTKSSDMKKHLVRKKICKATKDDVSLEEFKKPYFKVNVYLYNCDNCHKGFKTKHGHKNHVSNCKVVNVPLITNNEIVPFISSANDEIKELKSQLNELITLLKSNNINTTTNIINQDMSTKILNININALGYEQIVHLMNDIPFMKSCLMNDVKGLIQYIIKKWFSNDENSNIRILDIENGDIEYYYTNGGVDKKWLKTKLGNKFITTLTNYVGYDYQQFFEKNPTIFEHKTIDQVMRRIGLALEWELSHDEYDYVDDRLISKDELNIIKQEIYKQISEAIIQLHKK